MQKFTKWILKIDNYLEDLGFLGGGWGWICADVTALLQRFITVKVDR